METWGDTIVLMVMGIAILLAVAAVVLFFTFATRLLLLHVRYNKTTKEN